MKKILFLVLIATMLAMSYHSNAQSNFSHTTSSTITNTGIDTMNYTLTKGYSLIAVQYVLVRTSGTTAGTAALYHSVNGTDWTSDAGDTLTLANAARQSKYWTKATPSRYWRIITGGGTTVVATSSAKLQTD